MTKEKIKAIDALNDEAWNNNNILPYKALESARSALKESIGVNYKKGEADALLNIGWSMYYSSKLPETFEMFKEAMSVYEQIDDNMGKCKTLNAYGIYYYAQFRLDKAIEYYTASMNLAREKGFEDRELIAMSNLGEVCLELDNPKEALSYLIPAYDRRKTLEGSLIIADCLRIAGKAFLALDNYSLAEEFIKRAYQIALDFNDTIAIIDCFVNLSDIALGAEKYEKAENFALQGLAYSKKTENKMQIADLQLSLAAAYNKLGRSEEALEVLKGTAALYGDLKLKMKIPKAHEQMALAYEALGDTKNALYYYKRYSEFKAQAQYEASAQSLKNVKYEAELIKTRQHNEIIEQKNKELKEKSDELLNSNQRLKSISTMGFLITSSLDFKTVVNTIHKNLKPILSTDVFGIALYQKTKNQLVYKHFFDDGIYRTNWLISVDSQTSFAAWAFRNKKVVFINDYDKEHRTVLSGAATTRGRSSDSIICMPLAIEGRTIGVMTIQSYKKNAYDPQILPFLEALSPFVAIAVENSIIHDRVEVLNRALTDEKRRLERATLKISHLANHDSLTSLPNRRLLFELAEKAIETAKRSLGKVGLIYVDLDNFKPINDELGHNAGDNALISIAERLLQLVRASDIVARMGGDEFVIVITNAKSTVDIEHVAKKILSEFSSPLHFNGVSRIISMSMGISVYPENGNTIDELIIKADAAMYRIKHNTKNSYSFA